MATIGIDASRANAHQPSGAEWYAYHLIQALKNLETPDLEFVLYSREPLREGLERLPANWCHRLMPWKHLPFWTQGRLSLELLVHPVDLLFLPTHSVPLIRPRRVVTTLHDIGFERHSELYSPAELRYHRPMARRAVRIASRVLTVSEFSRREIIDNYQVDPARVTVTPNAVDPSIYHRSIPEETRAVVLARLGLARPFFLYVGRLEAKKNLVNILRAFAILRSWPGHDRIKLVLAGKPGFGFGDIHAEAATSGLGSALVLPGYLPEDDLPGLLAAADGLVFPSRYEGFGIPILQAQAVGTPVITAGHAAMPETAGGGAILVSADDPEAIARAMKNLVDDPELRASLRAAGFDNVKRYSWDETARITLNVFREVMGGETTASRSDRS